MVNKQESPGLTENIEYQLGVQDGQCKGLYHISARTLPIIGDTLEIMLSHEDLLIREAYLVVTKVTHNIYVEDTEVEKEIFEFERLDKETLRIPVTIPKATVTDIVVYAEEGEKLNEHMMPEQ